MAEFQEIEKFININMTIDELRARSNKVAVDGFTKLEKEYPNIYEIILRMADLGFFHAYINLDGLDLSDGVLSDLLICKCGFELEPQWPVRQWKISWK